MALTLLGVLARRKLVLALGLVVAVAVALANNYSVGLSSPFVSEKSQPVAKATAQLFVDFRESSITDATRTPDALSSRAGIYAELAQSDAVARDAAKNAGVPPGSFSIGSRVLTVKQASDATGSALSDASGQPVVVFTAVGGAPVINVEARATTLDVAVRLANGASRALRDFLISFSSTQKTPSRDQIRLRQLVGARGAIVSPTASKSTVIATAASVWLLIALLVVAFEYARQQSRAEHKAGHGYEEQVRVDAAS